MQRVTAGVARTLRSHSKFASVGARTLAAKSAGDVGGEGQRCAAQRLENLNLLKEDFVTPRGLDHLGSPVPLIGDCLDGSESVDIVARQATRVVPGNGAIELVLPQQWRRRHAP